MSDEKEHKLLLDMTNSVNRILEQIENEVKNLILSGVSKKHFESYLIILSAKVGSSNAFKINGCNGKAFLNIQAEIFDAMDRYITSYIDESQAKVVTFILVNSSGALGKAFTIKSKIQLSNILSESYNLEKEEGESVIVSIATNNDNSTKNYYPFKVEVELKNIKITSILEVKFFITSSI